MPTVDHILEFLDREMPFDLAESWDNVGLLVGSRDRKVNRLMTCLTVSQEVVDECQQNQVDLLVTHHPLPFQSLKTITCENTTGKLLLELIENKTAVISPHTGFDSAENGINQLLGERLGLCEIRPMELIDTDKLGVGKGRYGKLSSTLTAKDFAEKLKSVFQLTTVKTVSDAAQSVSKIGIACGSGGSFLEQVIQLDCDAMVTGEASFHTCLEARANGIGLFLIGHFASEQFALEILADRIGANFETLMVWSSKNESDPIRWM